VKLARTIDWGFLEVKFGSVYADGSGRPPLPTRLIAGLAILEHIYYLSDEVVCEQWIENLHYQYFCGEKFFHHRLPLDRSCATVWVRSAAGVVTGDAISSARPARNRRSPRPSTTIRGSSSRRPARPTCTAAICVERRNAEVGIHCVQQLPSQNLPARPVHYRDEVEEAAPHRNVGHVGAPDMVWLFDGQMSQQIRTDLVLRMRLAGLGKGGLRREGKPR
jgi:hypothetical protein